MSKGSLCLINSLLILSCDGGSTYSEAQSEPKDRINRLTSDFLEFFCGICRFHILTLLSLANFWLPCCSKTSNLFKWRKGETEVFQGSSCIMSQTARMPRFQNLEGYPEPEHIFFFSHDERASWETASGWEIGAFEFPFLFLWVFTRSSFWWLLSRSWQT